MKKIHLGLIGIATLFLTACTVGVSSNQNSVIKDTDSITNLTVTFDFNGGTYDSQTTVAFDNVKPTSYWKYVRARLDEEKIISPEHTTFKGFSSAQDDPKIIDDSYVIKEDITVYAQYEAKEGEYCTVNWKDGETSKIIKTETYFEGEKPELKDIPYHDGKTFDHWEPVIHAVTQEDITKGSIDYTAIYVPIKTIYDVTLDYDDGSGPHIQKVLNGECAVEPKITKEGYKLNEWEYVSGGTGTFDFSTPIGTNIEIKAIWVKATYTVTWLNYDGTVIKKEEVEDGGAPTEPNNPKVPLNPFADYDFLDWSPAVSKEIHSDQTYIATYQITHIYGDTKAYMHINIVDNKFFGFTFDATSNITIDWGDGKKEEKTAGTIFHEYKDSGEYSIRILDPITTLAINKSYKVSPHSTLIEELYLGKDVTSIGDNAFNGCSNLKTVNFEEESQLKSIEGSTFFGCSSLARITIPNSVTSIDFSAFEGCSSLTEITIPNSVTSISDSAFSGCSSLEVLKVDPKNATYTSQDKNGKECNAIMTKDGETLVMGCKATKIPNSVTLIGGSAFEGCSSLTNITIPNSVTSISSSAFSGCSNLKTVNFGEESQLKSISSSAFEGCSSLTEITIPDGVTSINSYTFNDCSSLTNITIPNSVTSISSSAFSGCSSLEVLKVDPKNATYTSQDKNGKECNAIMTKDGETLVMGCKATKIPNSVTLIGESAFEGCSSLTEITIPEGVTSIGLSAFVGCSSLTNITIPNSVTSISAFAFSECSSLEVLKVDPKNATYTSQDKNGKECNAIMTKDGETLVIGCKATKIPNSVTLIGNFAFYGCPSLTEITILEGVTSIGNDAFNGCPNLKTVNFDEDSQLKSIGDSAFEGCSSLTEITIPEGVTSINYSTFEGCSSLTNITIPSSVTSIGTDAFEGCSSLTEITIPNSVISISAFAFSECSSLEVLKVDPKNATYTSQDKNGKECNAIMTKDGETLVMGCKATKIPNSVTLIGESAFRDCSSLTEITIPEGVTSIGTSVFYGCSQLQIVDLTALNEVPRLNIGAFDFCHISLKLYVKPDLIEAFKAADGWKEYKDIITDDPVPSAIIQHK